jgi:uncharacterized protein YndB with AHSA1/START domain
MMRMRPATASLALVTVVGLTGACQEASMTSTDENKAFIKEMLGSKKQLTDYPDRFDPRLTMHEPRMLPFGGDYQGVDEFRSFYPKVRSYYDFSTWELLGVYGDGDTVFATTRVTIANTKKTMYIAEQFTFSGRKLVDVRVHVCDAENSDVRARVSIDLDATAQATFNAWVDPPLMERWMFKSPNNALEARTDPRTGGTFSIIEHDAGRVITHDGSYKVVQPPERLSFTLVVPQHFAGSAQIDVTITPRGSSSRLDFQATGAGPAGAQELWEKMIANLAKVLKGS